MGGVERVWKVLGQKGNQTMTIKVYYPHGGKKFLLEYYTYNERSRIVLADTEQSMMKTAKPACAKTGAEVRACFALEIVQPSELFCANKAIYDRAETVDRFVMDIGSYFSELIEKDIPLPGPFKKCDEYVNEEYDDDPNNLDDNAWMVEHHYDCANCKGRVQLIGMSKTELFDKYNDAWLKLYPRYVDKNLVESKARIASDDDDLWVVSGTGFGHHSSGITFGRAEIDDGLIANPIFFYKRLYDIDTTELKNFLDEENKGHKREQAMREANRKAQWEIDNKKRIDDLIAVFS